MSKRASWLSKYIFVVGLLLLTANFASASITVVCNGSACGGSGPRDYWYEVTLIGGTTAIAFLVGTLDTNPAHYTSGWMAQKVGDSWETISCDWGLGTGGFNVHTPMTPHGDGPVSPNGETDDVVNFHAFGTLTPGTYGFGFNNDSAPIDAGWAVDTSGPDAACNWSQVVGTGLGPVHAPAPEPATLGLLTLGGLALLRKKR